MVKNGRFYREFFDERGVDSRFPDLDGVEASNDADFIFQTGVFSQFSGDDDASPIVNGCFSAELVDLVDQSHFLDGVEFIIVIDGQFDGLPDPEGVDHEVREVLMEAPGDEDIRTIGLEAFSETCGNDDTPRFVELRPIASPEEPETLAQPGRHSQFLP